MSVLNWYEKSINLLKQNKIEMNCAGKYPQFLIVSFYRENGVAFKMVH